LVSTKPKNFILQALQPELLGIADLGHYVEVGRSLASNKNASRVADEWLKYNLTDDLQALQELSSKNPQTTVGKVIRTLGLPVEKTAGRVYGSFERSNRKVTFLGGRQKFLDAYKKGGEAGLDAAFDYLPSGQAYILRRALKEQGPEVAANIAGLISANRINFIYGVADRPDILMSKLLGTSKRLGDVIPFTTFTRGSLMRLIEANPKNAAALIAITLIATEMLIQTTGYSIPGVNLISSIASVGMPTITPAIQEPIKVFMRTGSVVQTGKKALEMIVPFYAAFDRYQKVQASGGGVPEHLGLKKEDKNIKRRITKEVKKLVK